MQLPKAIKLSVHNGIMSIEFDDGKTLILPSYESIVFNVGEKSSLCCRYGSPNFYTIVPYKEYIKTILQSPRTELVFSLKPINESEALVESYGTFYETWLKAYHLFILPNSS